MKLPAVLVATGLLATVASAAALYTRQGPPVGAATDWAFHGGAPDESGYSGLAEIDSRNVGRLGLANFLDLDGEVSLEATPLAIGGTLYFTGSYSAVYAVDAASGRLLWKYDPKIWDYNPHKQAMSFGVNRGAAYAGGLIFSGVLDGRLIALDARTGRLVWSVDTVPSDDAHTVVSAPRVFNGKVIIGNSGADANMRGYVTAYDQKTGRRLWRFYTVPGSPEENKGDPAMEMAARTWGPSAYWQKGGGGGTVWNGITFDPELNRIYLGTGNGGPFNPRLRDPGGGDDLFLSSIVALDADSGRYVWHYQVNPRDSWDYKATANMIATTLTIDGKPRKVLMQSPTNGFFYVLDRETGRLISAEKIGKVNWADRIDLKTGRPVEHPNIRYESGETLMYPSQVGAHNWQDMAFNPKTGLVYIPYMKLGARYTTSLAPGDFDFGGVTADLYRGDPDDGTGALLAWDPIAQRQRWKVPIETIWNGGALSTAGNLVFQGSGDGYFTAYDATSGRRLWRLYAGLGIIAPPISYAVDGRQYVSVLVGYGGTTAALAGVMNVGWKYGAQPRRLLTFSLGGAAKLPPSPPRDMTVNAVDDSAIKLDKAVVAAGLRLSVMCAACHGIGFHSAGAPAPDLRESQLALNEEAFAQVVQAGAFKERGMPQFAALRPDQLHALWSAVRAAARDALASPPTKTAMKASP